MKLHHSDNPAYIAEVIGQRLKRARLNRDMTQVEVADRAWVSKRTVLKAEKGDVRLADLIAILRALEMLNELDSFLPEPPLSPIQLLKLRGKIRQRASGKSEKSKNESHQSLDW